MWGSARGCQAGVPPGGAAAPSPAKAALSKDRETANEIETTGTFLKHYNTRLINEIAHSPRQEIAHSPAKIGMGVPFGWPAPACAISTQPFNTLLAIQIESNCTTPIISNA